MENNTGRIPGVPKGTDTDRYGEAPKPGLHLLCGRAGSGKTAYLTECLVNHIRRGERALLIVPEQHTFDAERRIAKAAGGLIGVQVLSMERLAERTLAESGDQRSYLTRQGVCLAIRRSCHRHAGELRSFRNANRARGFTSEMAKLIAALKQAAVTPEMLTVAAEQLKDKKMLCDKLHDVALICSDLDEWMEDRFLTVDDGLNMAMDKLKHSFAKGIDLYIDGIPAATGQMFQAIGELMSVARSVTVALTLDPGEPEAEIFETNRLAYTRLQNMAQQRGLPLFVRNLIGDRRRQQAPELAFLERYLFRETAAGEKETVYKNQEVTNAVTLCEQPGIRAEVRAMCDSVYDMLREGIPLSDMEVIVTDPERYLPVMERVCATYEIPLYADTRRLLTGHGAARLMLDAVAAVAGGYRGEDVLSVLKSGYAGVTPAEGELFENYVLKTRTRFSMFFKPITRDENAEMLEQVRTRLMTPLKRLEEGLNAPSAGKKVRAVYGYLTDLGVKETLTAEAETLQQEGNVTEAERFSQVWNAMVTLLEQTDLLLGETEIDTEEFRMLLEEGVADLKVGVLPDSTGALTVSPLPRAGMTSIPVQFILGCTDGLFPKDHTDDGILNDEERKCLRECNCAELTGTEFVSGHERLLIYETLARPTKRLWMSYPLDDTNGMQKSALFARVGELIPNHTKLDVASNGQRYPSCRYDALNRLTEGLSHRVSDKEVKEDPFATVYAWFRQNEPELCNQLKRASENEFGALLPADLTKKLYGARLRMSPSRLEEFNECPFRHFMDYGLHAQERDVYEESVMDLGTFYHEALNAFFRYITENEIDIATLTGADCDGIVSALITNVIRNHNDRFLEEDPRTKATLFLIQKTVHQSVKAVVRQLQAGGFEPLGSEVKFGRGEAFPPILLETEDGVVAELYGTVDRVDRAKDDEEIRRVVDYKLNGKSINWAEVREGLALQLPLYLLAAMNGTPKKGKTAGMYYMPIRIKPIAEKDATTPEKWEEAVAKQFLMKGLTLSNPEILLLTDKQLQGEGSVTSTVVCSLTQKKDGTLGSRAVVADEEEFLRVLESAKQKSAETLSSIMRGEWKASPYEGKCQYCLYKSVCRFDIRLPNCKKRSAKTVKLSDFLGKTEVPAT